MKRIILFFSEIFSSYFLQKLDLQFLPAARDVFCHDKHCISASSDEECELIVLRTQDHPDGEQMK